MRITNSKLEGIGGAANTPGGPSYVILLSYLRGIGGAASTPWPLIFICRCL